ncbi:hypothetical protein ACKKBG_A00750 [Auxenochlorella protothecoides x Auxenochlorella symbiontica]
MAAREGGRAVQHLSPEGFRHFLKICDLDSREGAPFPDADISGKGDGTMTDEKSTIGEPPVPDYSAYWPPIQASLPQPIDNVEDDTEMDDRIRAKLYENGRGSAAWSGLRDDTIEAMITNCLKNKDWKKQFAQKLLREELETSGKGAQSSSTSPAASELPVHSAQSALGSWIKSEAENVHELANLASACRRRAMSKPQQAKHQVAYTPDRTSSSSRSPKSGSTPNQVCPG